jgi:hypothetical protein
MDILQSYTRAELITTAGQLHRLLETRGPIGNPILQFISCYDILMDIQQHLDDTTCRCSPDEGIACGVEPAKGGYCHGIEDDPEWASHVAWQARKDTNSK